MFLIFYLTSFVPLTYLFVLFRIVYSTALSKLLKMNWYVPLPNLAIKRKANFGELCLFSGTSMKLENCVHLISSVRKSN